MKRGRTREREFHKEMVEPEQINGDLWLTGEEEKLDLAVGDWRSQNAGDLNSRQPI